MPVVIPPKHVVAMHEAGHAIVTLVTPLRPFIREAWIFDNQEHWEGRLVIDGKAATQAKVSIVYDFARAIAGPLAQIHFYPKSIPDNIRNEIEKAGGLLHATRQIDTQQIPVDDVQWWPDLKDWISFFRQCPTFKGTDFVDTEKSIMLFLQESTVVNSISSLAQKLTDRERLDAAELLAHPIAGIPTPALPPKLRFL